MPDAAAQRREMVRRQLRGRGISDPRVLEAMARVPREFFVERGDQARAYADTPLDIGFGQTISQPYMVGLICQEAGVAEGDRVLDVGTGSGYQAAVLAAMGAEVYSVERISQLADRARRALSAAGYPHVRVVVGDGSLGLPSATPFDAILVAAAAPEPPEALYEQLGPGGRLVVPVGDVREQRLEVVVRTPEGPAVARSVPCRFVPLVGAGGYEP